MRHRLLSLGVVVATIGLLMPLFTGHAIVRQQAYGQILEMPIKTLASGNIGIGGKDFKIASGGFYKVSRDVVSRGYIVKPVLSLGSNICDADDFMGGVECYIGLASGQAVAGASIELEGAIGFDFLQNQTTDNNVTLRADGGLIVLADSPIPSKTKHTNAPGTLHFGFIPNKDKTGKAKVDLLSKSGAYLSSTMVELVDIFPPNITVEQTIKGMNYDLSYDMYFTDSASPVLTGKINDFVFFDNFGAAYPSGGLGRLIYTLVEPRQSVTVATGSANLSGDGSFVLRLSNVPEGISILTLAAQDSAGNANDIPVQILREGNVSSLTVTRHDSDSEIDSSKGGISFDPPYAFYGRDKNIIVTLSFPRVPSLPQRVEVVIKNSAGDILKTFREVTGLSDTLRLADQNTASSFSRKFIWDISDNGLYKPGAYTFVIDARTFAGQSQKSTLVGGYMINTAKISDVTVSGEKLLSRENTIYPLQVDTSEIKPVVTGKVQTNPGMQVSIVQVSFYWANSSVPALGGGDYIKSNGEFGFDFSKGQHSLSFNTIYRLEIAPLIKAGGIDRALPVFVTSVYFLRPQVEADDNPPIHDGDPRFLPEQNFGRVIADGKDHYIGRVILVDSFGNTIPNATITAKSGAGVAQTAYDIDINQVAPGFNGSAIAFSDFSNFTNGFPVFNSGTGQFTERSDLVFAKPDLRTLRYDIGIASLAPTVDDRSYRSLIKDGSFTAVNHADHWLYDMASDPDQRLLFFQNERDGIKAFVPGGDAAFMKPSARLRQGLVGTSGFKGDVFQVHLWARRVGGVTADIAKLNIIINAEKGPDTSEEFKTHPPIIVPFSGDYEEYFFPFTVDSTWQAAELIIENVGNTIIAIGKVRVEETGKNSLKGHPGERVIDIQASIELASGESADLFAVDTDLPLFALNPNNPNIKGTDDPLRHSTHKVSHGYLTLGNDKNHGVSMNFQPALLVNVEHLFSLDPIAVNAASPIVLRGNEREHFRVTIENKSESVRLSEINLNEIIEFDTKFEAGFSNIILEQGKNHSGLVFQVDDRAPTTNIKQLPLPSMNAIALGAGEKFELYISAVPFAPTKLRELRGVFDSLLNYKISNFAGTGQSVSVDYPGLAFPIETLFGSGQVRTDIEADLLRESILLSILKTKEHGPELVGDFTVEKLRDLVDKSVNSLVRSGDLNQFNFGSGALQISNSQELAALFAPNANAWSSMDGKVAFIRGRNVILGNLNSRGSLKYPSGVHALIVEGGNIIIAADIEHPKDDDSFGIIARRSRDEADQPHESDVSFHRFDKVPGGNVFLHPLVKNLEGSLYLEGLLLSYDTDSSVNNTTGELTSLWNALHYHDRFDDEESAQNDSGENLIKSGANIGKYPVTMRAGIYPVAEASRVVQLENQLYFRGTLVTGQGDGITYRNSWNGSASFDPNDEGFALAKVLDLARMREFQNKDANKASFVPQRAKQASVVIEKDQRLFREETIPPGFKLTGLSWEEL